MSGNNLNPEGGVRSDLPPNVYRASLKPVGPKSFFFFV